MPPKLQSEPEAPLPVLAKGYYRLVVNVPNPKPDKRSNRLHCAVVWAAGTLVKIKPGDGQRVGSVEFMDGTQVFYGGGPGKGFEECRVGDGIVRAAVPAPDTLGIVLREGAAGLGGGDTVLAVLIDTGKLTLEDVKAALAVADAMPDDSGETGRNEYAAMQKRHGLRQ